MSGTTPLSPRGRSLPSASMNTAVVVSKTIVAAPFVDEAESCSCCPPMHAATCQLARTW